MLFVFIVCFNKWVSINSMINLKNFIEGRINIAQISFNEKAINLLLTGGRGFPQPLPVPCIRRKIYYGSF